MSVPLDSASKALASQYQSILTESRRLKVALPTEFNSLTVGFSNVSDVSNVFAMARQSLTSAYNAKLGG